MSNSIRVRMVGSQAGIALIKIQGFLDTVSAYALQEQGEELIMKGVYHYILDLDNLEYISSAGIEAFHTLAQKLQPYEGEIIFVRVPEKIYKVLEIIGTTTFFQFKPTIRDAIKEFDGL